MSLLSTIFDEIKADLRDRIKDAYGEVLNSVRRYLAKEIQTWPKYFVPGTSVYAAVIKYVEILTRHLNPDTPTT